MISWLMGLSILPIVSALALVPRTNTACGQYDTINFGPYSLLTNLWGEANATSGSQCSTLQSVHGNIVTWTTDWLWIGGKGIKSFSNIQLNVGINQPLSAITSMQSLWHWYQEIDEETVTNVAFDLFTSDSPSGSGLNEVMIWLANVNAGPISFEYTHDGKALPVATNLNIAGYTWDLYYGSNGHNLVYTYLPVHGPIYHFNNDIYGFFTHLIESGYIKSSEYLTTAQAGTEATSGSAKFTTTAYSLTIA